MQAQRWVRKPSRSRYLQHMMAQQQQMQRKQGRLCCWKKTNLFCRKKQASESAAATLCQLIVYLHPNSRAEDMYV